MTECRPPEGTPDGTVCWVQRFCATKPEPAFWGFDNDWLRIGEVFRFTPAEMARAGYRFHSIAKPPEG